MTAWITPAAQQRHEKASGGDGRLPESALGGRSADGAAGKSPGSATQKTWVTNGLTLRIAIADSELGSASNASVATFGPWTVAFSCSVSPTQSTVTISGPGSYHRSDELGTSSVTFNQSSGTVPVSLTVSDTAAQGSQALILQSGATIEHVTLE